MREMRTNLNSMEDCGGRYEVGVIQREVVQVANLVIVHAAS